MGKHAAPGSSSHPLVTAALAQRTAGGGAHRGGRRPANEGPLGWPGSAPAPDGGLGWPVDASEEQAGEEPAPRARSVWRRLFGVEPAA